MPGELLNFGPSRALELIARSQDLDARGLIADADLQFERAVEAIDASSRHDLDSERAEARIYEARAEQLARRGDYVAALRFADTADRIRVRTGQAAPGIGAGKLHARLLWATGDVAGALERARQNLASTSATPSTPSTSIKTEIDVDLRLDMAEYLHAAERPSEALDMLAQCDRQALLASERRADAAWLEGLCAREVGRFERAERCLRVAFQEWLARSRFASAARAANALAQVALEQGRPAELLDLAAVLDDTSEPVAQRAAACFREVVSLVASQGDATSQPAEPLKRLRELDRTLEQAE